MSNFLNKKDYINAQKYYAKDKLFFKIFYFNLKNVKFK